MNHAAEITAARARYQGACQRLRIARERGCHPTTIVIFEVGAELAAAYCARVESASVEAAR